MVGKTNKLIFANSEKARDAITVSQQKEIAKLYEEWSRDLGERAKYYRNKATSSAALSERQAKELQKALAEQSKQVSNEVYKGIKQSIYTVSDAVVKDNVEWLKSLGFTGDLDAAFSSVPDSIVRMLVTGQIYEGGWNLSSRIWGSNEKTLSNCYQIVAKGMAENRPIYDIAKELEKYVSPETAKSWNPLIRMKNTKTGEWEYKRIYRGKVDYNAQRLARTLVQHGYQQSFIAVTEKNPFVLKYQWSANGSRPCPLCMDRDGQTFEKGNLPMDHPNGQCTMVPVVDDNIVDKLADWFNSPDGTYPEIDEFANNFGYVPGVSSQQQTEVQIKWLSAAGYKDGQMPKDFKDFIYKLSFDQQGELLKEAGGNWGVDYPYQKMEAYYNANIAKAGKVQVAVASAGDISSLGTSKGKTFNYWYAKLDDTQKDLAKQLKEQSGLTWQQWYEQNIYSGNKVSAAQAAKAATNGTPMPAKSGTAYDTWIKSMRGQTESSMLSTEASQFAKMTESQVNGIRKYSGSSYTEMNGYLRSRAQGLSDKEARKISGITESQMKAMKEAQAGLKKAALTQDTYLRRGTDVGDLAGFMSGNFDDNKRALERMGVNELRNKFVGTQGTYAGFTSTSSLYDRGFSGSVEVIMHAPPGTEATSIMTVSQYGTGEGETLLNSGTKVEITAIEKSDGHMGSNIRVFMEIIGKK